MTSQERRIKRLHDHVVGNQKKAEPTNKELQAMLTEKGIEFDVRANKAELLKLLEAEA